MELIDRNAVRDFIKSYRHSTDVAFDMEKHLDEIPAASPWHRVEDGLPPDGVDVLGCMEYSIGHKSLWVVHHTNTKDKVWNDGTITHWMPIEPPREDA